MCALPSMPLMSSCAAFCLPAKWLKLTVQLYRMCVQCVHSGISGAWVRLSPPHDLPNRQLAAGGLHVSCSWCLSSSILRALAVSHQRGAMCTTRRIGICA
jgi:hypothetical protein